MRHAPAARLPAGLDAVLISHLHRDHLDRPTLRGLPAGARMLGPRGLAAALRGDPRAQELDCGDVAQLAPGVTVTATPARHDNRRSPLERRERGPALGFVVEGDGVRVYFAGDTDVFAGMQRIGAPGLDVALLPIAGWGPRLGPGHMDSAGAAQAAALLRPAVVIPIHWGTYLVAGLHRRDPGLLERPAQEFAQAVAAAPGVEVAVLRPGETLRLGGRSRGAPVGDGAA